MAVTVLAAGRFDVGLFVRAAQEPALQIQGATSWGFGYCYGNRVEVVRSDVNRPDRQGFDALADVRTDMAMLHLANAGAPRPGARGCGQVCFRREGEQTWAFCLEGVVRYPERLELGHRIPDGPSAEERFFLHLLQRLDLDRPDESLAKAASELSDEAGLTWFLLSKESLMVRAGSRGNQESGLWLGNGRLLKVLAPVRLSFLQDLEWEPVVPDSMLAITRDRRVVS